MENIGRSVRVYWENEDDWYSGFVEDYIIDKGFHIQYNDGDEEWLATLQGVEFENEELGNTDNVDRNNEYKDDYEDNIGVEDGELGIEFAEGTALRTLSVSPVSSPMRSARRGHEEVGEEKAEQDVIHSMDDGELDFQSSLHSTKELSTNGVLIKGEVLGANNLPSASHDHEVEAAGVFYRVLYAEGGDESAVFRCKTPIYKSEVTCDLEFPRWGGAEQKFRFEMVLPGDEGLLEADFTDHGDIIVALYRSRSNGGSDFLGQVSIQLQDFVRVGTVGKARPRSHCRLLRGCFPLINRHGDIVGDGLADVDLNISLEWRLVDKPASAGAGSRTAIEEITVRSSQQAKRGGGVKGRGVETEKRPRSGRGGRSLGGRNSSAAMSSLKASRRGREQSVLERENDKLRSRLERAGPKQNKRPAVAGQKASDATTVSEVYAPSAPADKKKPAGKRGGGSKGEDKRLGPLTASKKIPSNLNHSHEELVVEYERMKKKVGEARLELRSLHTTDSKLKTLVAKNEAVTGRLKKIELSNRKKSSVESSSKAKDEGSHGVDEFSVENLLLRAGLEGDEERLDDELLRERLVEHSVLQASRKACLDREQKARLQLAEDEASLKNSRAETEEKYRELEARASKLDTPKNDWNLHVLNKESKLVALKSEVDELNMIRKLQLDPALSK